MTFLRSHERQNYYFNISTLILQQKFPFQNQRYYFFFSKSNYSYFLLGPSLEFSDHLQVSKRPRWKTPHLLVLQ